MNVLSEMFRGIFNMSITASIVILVALILRLLLCRAPKGYSYLLWGLVLFRLLCPISLPSDFSALDFSNGQVTEQGGMEYFTVHQPEDISASVTLIPGNKEIDLTSGKGEGEPSAESVRATVSFQKRMLPVLSVVWLAGLAGMMAYSIITMVRLRKRVECSIWLQDNIYLADYIPSPFVLGLLQPRIFLPSGLGEQEREYILFHEQYHIRRRDYLVKPVAFLALCLHWFNPLVWLAFILAGRDMEMSCDEAVMRKMHSDMRREYASSLLHLSTGKSVIAGSPLAFGEGNPKGRIKNVMRYRKPAVILGVAAAVVLVVAAVCLLTNPAAKRPTMEWAKNLRADQVAYAELVVMSQDPERQYQYFSENEVEDIVDLIRESRGKYLADHEEGDGGSIFFYLTMKDGTTHEVGNIGNVYLFIDGDYYDAGYDWLSGWDDAFGTGNDWLPAGFFGEVAEDAMAVFQARVLEMNSETMLVEPVEGSGELDSADQFSIPIRQMEPSPEPEVGDLVEISYNGTIMESYPAQLGEVYRITVIENVSEPGTSGTDPSGVSGEGDSAMSLKDQAITDAIMEHNVSRHSDEYDFACCSFAELDTPPAESAGEDGTELMIYYGWALYQEYKISPKGIENVGGSHIPVALTFEIKDGAYALQEYWEPGDGALFMTDIQEKFPAELAQDGIDSQKFILAQIQNCYGQAVAYADLNTDAVIENLLGEICAGGPGSSSNPQDYIEAHKLEYRELGYYGDFTVRYCLKRFEAGSETGLEGQIMARICEELLGMKGKIPEEAETASDGQKWYEALKAHASNVVEEYLE